MLRIRLFWLALKGFKKILYTSKIGWAVIHPGRSKNGRERNKPQEFVILSQVLKLLILLFGKHQTVSFF